MTDRRMIRLRDSKGNDLGQPAGDGGFAYDGGELLRAVPKPSDWGPWRLDASNLVLHAGEYEIHLYECDSAAKVLDWIAQIAGKSWGDNETLAGLVRVLDDVLDMQANLCSFGQSGEPLTRERLHEMASAAVVKRSEAVRVYPELDAGPR
jgi:hypothetical protein